MAAKHKHSANNCKQPHQANPNHVTAKGMGDLEILEVIHKANGARSDKQPANNRD